MKQLFTLLAILSLAQATFSQDEDVADSTSYVEEESNVISSSSSNLRNGRPNLSLSSRSNSRRSFRFARIVSLFF